MPRVAAVQFAPRPGEPATDARARLTALADEAATGSDLVVLPELCATPYLHADRAAVEAIAEGPDGPLFQALAPIAKGRGCWLVAGFVERAGDRLYNSALVVDRGGACVFVYRKSLLFDADVPWATPGDSGYAVLGDDTLRFGVGICMDLNDDRFVAWVRDSGAPIVAFPTNWIDEGENVWWYWAWRLEAVRTTLVAANKWGREPNGDAVLGFTGESAVLVDGVAVAAAGFEGDAIVRAIVP